MGVSEGIGTINHRKSPLRNRPQAQNPPRACPATEPSPPVANPASGNQLRPCPCGGPRADRSSDRNHRPKQLQVAPAPEHRKLLDRFPVALPDLGREVFLDGPPLGITFGQLRNGSHGRLPTPRSIVVLHPNGGQLLVGASKGAQVYGVLRPDDSNLPLGLLAGRPRLRTTAGRASGASDHRPLSPSPLSNPVHSTTMTTDEYDALLEKNSALSVSPTAKVLL